MGFENPITPWSELERRLSGRPEAKPAAKPNETPARRGHGDDRGPDGGDSPAWSRKRPGLPAPADPADQPAERRPRSPTPSCTRTRPSPSSTARPTRSSWSRRRSRLGLQALALTDHDGMYGVARFAEAADALGLPTVFGAELNTGIPLPPAQTERSIAARVGVPDPPGTHLLVLARNPAGYASLCRAISQAQLRGGAKGRPVYDLDELAELSDDNWLILTGCRKGSVRQALDADGYGTFALDPARRRWPSSSTGSAATTSPSS